VPEGARGPAGARGWVFELAGGRRLEAGKRPLVVGILNVTPDSFSDGGVHADARSAVEAGLRMIEEGADWIDIGGESTRPGSRPVPAAEQLRRVLPVLGGLRMRTPAPISIDTQDPDVGERSLAEGADILNDVGGFGDERWRSVVTRWKAPLVVMHMQGTPLDMQVDPRYPRGVTREVRAFFESRTQSLLDWGVDRSRIIIDPGLGFGKRVQDNLELVRNIDVLKDLGYPVFIGASRKGFIEKAFGPAPFDQDTCTLTLNAFALCGGADMLRVHNVKYTAALVKLFVAVRSAPMA